MFNSCMHFLSHFHFYPSNLPTMACSDWRFIFMSVPFCRLANESADESLLLVSFLFLLLLQRVLCNVHNTNTTSQPSITEYVVESTLFLHWKLHYRRYGSVVILAARLAHSVARRRSTSISRALLQGEGYEPNRGSLKSLRNLLLLSVSFPPRSI